MRGTKKQLAPRGGQSSSRPSTAPSQPVQRTRPAAQPQTRSVRQKVSHGKGKRVASETESSDEDSPSADSGSESVSPAGSDDDITVPPVQPTDLRLLSADDYAVKRHVNQYLFKSNTENSRFHTLFQEQVYEQLYGRHRKFANHKWIKWEHITDLDKYSNVYQLFHTVGLKDFVSLRHNYDDDIIRQFYATVHVSADQKSLRWISVTRNLESTKEEFEQALRINSGSWEKIFESPALLAPAWTEHYDLSAKCKLGTITGLKPEVSMVNRIINHTFYPKSGNFDAIRGHAWNIIDHIMKGIKFDVVDVILQGIVSSKNDRVKSIYYAPYIMTLIMSKIEYRGGLGSAHKSYRPRDGLPPAPAPAEATPAAAPAEATAPAEGILAQILQNQQQILNTLQELKTELAETRNKLHEMESVQNDFFEETHNRMAILAEGQNDLEDLLKTPQRFTRRGAPSSSVSPRKTPRTVAKSYASAPQSSTPAPPPAPAPATQAPAPQASPPAPPAPAPALAPVPDIAPEATPAPAPESTPVSEAAPAPDPAPALQDPAPALAPVSPPQDPAV